MKKYIITVECIETYEIMANNEDEACDKADEMFKKADHTIYIEDEEEYYAVKRARECVLVTHKGAGPPPKKNKKKLLTNKVTYAIM